MRLRQPDLGAPNATEGPLPVAETDSVPATRSETGCRSATGLKHAYAGAGGHGAPAPHHALPARRQAERSGDVLWAAALCHGYCGVSCRAVNLRGWTCGISRRCELGAVG